MNFLKSKPTIFVLFLCMVYTLINYIPVFMKISNWGVNDWDSALTWIASSSDAIFRNGNFPLWNTYVDGGRPFFNNPEHIMYYPFFYLFFWIENHVIALKLYFIFHIFLTTLFSFFLSRKITQNTYLNILMTIILSSNSAWALNFAQAHIYFVGYTWFILLAHVFFYKNNTKQFLFVTSFSFTMMILCSSAYFYVLSSIALGIYCLIELLKKNSRFIILGIIAQIMTVSVTSFKVIPELFFFDVPRISTEDTGSSLASIYQGFVNRNQNIFWEDQELRFKESLKETPSLEKNDPTWLYGIREEWPDNGMYLTLPIFILMLMSFIYNLYKRKSLAITAFITIILSFGHHITYGPWSLLSRLPIFENMGSFTRFNYIFLPIAIIMLIKDIDKFSIKIKNQLNPKFVTSILLLLIIFLSYEYTRTNHRIMINAYPFQAAKIKNKYEPPIYLSPDDYIHYGAYNLSNPIAQYPKYLKGIRSSEKVEDRTNQRLINVVSYNDEEYRGEIYGLTTGPIKKNLIKFNSDIIEFEIDYKNDRYVINQNYDPNWTSPMAKVRNFRGLISIEPYYAGKIKLYYKVDMLRYLMIISTIFLIIWGLLLKNNNLIINKLNKFLAKLEN